MQLLQRDTEQSRVREEPSDPSPTPALPVMATRMCLGGRGHPQPPKCPVLMNCWAKSNGSSCSFSCWEQSCCWSGCSGTGQTPTKSPALKTDAQAESSKNAQGYQSNLTITAPHFNQALQFFAYNAFFSVESLFYVFYIEFHLALLEQSTSTSTYSFLLAPAASDSPPIPVSLWNMVNAYVTEDLLWEHPFFLKMKGRKTCSFIPNF